MSAPEPVKEAFEVLRRWAIERVEHDQSVCWYEDWDYFYAEPCSDKYPGAWLVRSGHSEFYLPKARILEQLTRATAISLSEY